MDNYALHSLGKALYFLQQVCPLLDDLLFPFQGQKESSGVTVKASGSKPPLNISMLDLKTSVEKLLWFWSVHLAAEQLLSPPASRRVEDTSGWLLAHIGFLEEVEWAGCAVEEILAEAELVRAAVDPNFGEQVEMPEWATARETTRWLQNQGFACSRSAVMRWIDNGVVDTRSMDDGRILVRVESAIVAACVRQGLASLI